MTGIWSHNRYLAPKWRARVIPGDREFGFSNGIRVASLWELKQALLTLSEDVIVSHLSDNRNDMATWVEFVVGDVELALEMRKYNHRWGMIVALERHMMRTLELPDYVAKRWLGKTNNPFTFVSREKIFCLEELRDILVKITDETVAFHCERFPNDIAVWVLDSVGDYEMAQLLSEANSRMQMQRFCADHIEMLKDAAE